MKKFIPLFLISLILLAGCATPQPEIRYYKSYNKPPHFDSYIQGDSYTIWYSKDLEEHFVEIEKGTNEWQSLQKEIGIFTLQHAFYNRESGICAVIAKHRYKSSYDKVLDNVKKSSVFSLIESDQRMVNNSPALYIRYFIKEGGNNMIVSAYHINTDLGTLMFLIACLEDEYGEYRKMIQDALNGIEVN